MQKSFGYGKATPVSQSDPPSLVSRYAPPTKWRAVEIIKILMARKNTQLPRQLKLISNNLNILFHASILVRRLDITLSGQKKYNRFPAWTPHVIAGCSIDKSRPTSTSHTRILKSFLIFS